MKTSTKLEPGQVYTRADLRDEFDIVDSTINNGVFHPKGHDSVWLFVTRHKERDMTDYEDRLHGDDLTWDGQLSGRTDDLIISHRDRGLELLLFYRDHKREFPGGGFRYEGPFEYVSHRGGGPTHFRLVRVR